MEIFLAKLFGIYFLIVGIVITIRRKAVMPTIRELAANRSLLLVLGAVEVIAGLAIALYYPTISWSVEGILSLIGYMMVIEGILYLAAPARFVQKFIAAFNRPKWYLAGGLLSVIVGIYLAGNGFGYF